MFTVYCPHTSVADKIKITCKIKENNKTLCFHSFVLLALVMARSSFKPGFNQKRMLLPFVFTDKENREGVTSKVWSLSTSKHI